MTISIYDYRDFLRAYRSGSDERVTEDREHFGVCRVFRDWLRRMEAVNPEAAWSYMEDRFQARLGWSLDDGCYPFGYPPATGAHLIPARAAFVEAEWEWAREMCAYADFILKPFMVAGPNDLAAGLCMGFEPAPNSGKHFEYMYAKWALRDALSHFADRACPFGGPQVYENELLARSIRQNLERIAFVEAELARLGEAEEMQRLAKDEGISETLLLIDQLTGGDGEYRFCLNHASDQHCPDEDAMQAKIIARFEALRAELAATKARLGDATHLAARAVPVVAMAHYTSQGEECLRDLKAFLAKEPSQ